jgi:hypothetical protein
MSCIALHVALICLTANENEPELLKRVQSAAPLTGRVERIVKDADGNITHLRLDGMALSASDFAAIGRNVSLKHLSLNKTNVTNKDLRQLQKLDRLTGIALNETEITDGAVEELAAIPALKTLCLGRVKVTPAAVERLKALIEADGRRLSLGYTQRK